MKTICALVCLLSSVASASPRPRDSVRDRDAAILAELQTTLEKAAADRTASEQDLPAEAPLLERANLHAGDHPEFRED